MSIQDQEIKVNKEDSNFLNSQKQSGGLFLGFIFVLILSSILALALWINQISETNTETIKSYEERIGILEEQLSIVDSVNTDSMTGIASQLQFLDKEIRKLWDLSNKRNKVQIQEITKQVDVINKSIKLIEDTTGKLSLSNSDDIKDLTNKLSSIEADNKSIDKIYKDLKSLNTDFLLLEESIQAFDNYRKQNNEYIIQLQNKIRLLENNSQNLNSQSNVLE
jgi:chromosome segregation ATPase